MISGGIRHKSQRLIVNANDMTKVKANTNIPYDNGIISDYAIAWICTNKLWLYKDGPIN